MRQIKIERLRPMNCFAETRHEFAHYNFIKEAGLKHNSADHPQDKESKGRDPWPPSRPGALVGTPRCGVRSGQRADPTTPWKQSNPGQEERIRHRAFDQQRDSE